MSDDQITLTTEHGKYTLSYTNTLGIDIPSPVLDFIKIFEAGALKYAANGWLDKSGAGTSHKEMHDSMFHHLAESFSGATVDEDSGEHPLLHLAIRAVMAYTRYIYKIPTAANKEQRLANIAVNDKDRILEDWYKKFPRNCS